MIMDEKIKIKNGYTNFSYKRNGFFYQIKNKNGLNHLSNNSEISKFQNAPKLISDSDNHSEWEWINGNNLENPSDQDLINLANILYKLHNSNLKLAKFNIKNRINTYRKILKEKNIKINIVEKLYRKINLILKNMDKNTPIHGDLYKVNMIKTSDNKIYLVDWEYSHMGDRHYELAYIIEAYEFTKEKEKIFLDAYNDYDPYILKKHKVLVNYITVLWLYSQEKLHFSPDNLIKKLEKLYEEGF